MFTGIIQSKGTIVEVSKEPEERHFVIEPEDHNAFSAIIDGESIAINGCCLSVETHTKTVFSFYASAETLSCSTLGSLQKGSLVNLERALRPEDRLGGHLVTGHVDAVVEVLSLLERGHSLAVSLSYPPSLAAHLVAKGSVTLDGISLTINRVDPKAFHVNIIPDTRKRTAMCLWQKGSRVNMETDILGKYVERILGLQQKEATTGEKKSVLSKEFLARYGFLS